MAGDNYPYGTAAVLSAQPQPPPQLVTWPGEWAVAAQATAGTPSASKAAGAAGVRHVCTSVSLSVACAATAQPAIVVNLRDGATGVGTILHSFALAAPVNQMGVIALSGLNLVGSAATAMTLEFASASAAGVIASVDLAGYDVA